MGPVQVASTMLAAAATILAAALVTAGVVRMVRVIRPAEPDPIRTGASGGRRATMLRGTLGRTRMVRGTRCAKEETAWYFGW
jgi:hypothetical protein